MLEMKCPNCPICGAEPAIIILGTPQAFCGNDDCSVLVWDCTISALSNLLDMGEVAVTEVNNDETAN